MAFSRLSVLVAKFCCEILFIYKHREKNTERTHAVAVGEQAVNYPHG